MEWSWCWRELRKGLNLLRGIFQINLSVHPFSNGIGSIRRNRHAPNLIFTILIAYQISGIIMFFIIKLNRLAYTLLLHSTFRTLCSQFNRTNWCERKEHSGEHKKKTIHCPLVLLWWSYLPIQIIHSIGLWALLHFCSWLPLWYNLRSNIGGKKK